MSDADNTNPDLPLQPPADLTAPLPDLSAAAEGAPGELHEATASFAPPAMEPPAAPAFPTEAPTEQLPAQHFPTQQFPAQQYPTAAEAPTAAMPSVAPAPSSVVLSTNSPAAPKKKGVLAWALAGIAAIAAVVFAILWVGKSGDADDLTTERKALVAEKSTLEDELATAKADLETAQGDLDSTSADLDAATTKATDLESQIDDLTGQVDDLTGELEAAQNQPATGAKAIDYAPGLSLGLGQALGSNASPPLSEAEALCLGSNILDRAGVDLLFIDYFEDIEPTDAEANKIGRAFLDASDACSIDFSRLNLGDG